MTELDVMDKNYSNKLDHWKNDDNAQYYEHLPLETFHQYAEAAGLDTCCDLELIRPQIMQANSILEVAAGYGRVIDGLLNMGYNKRIVAIERCAKLYPLLQKPHTEAIKVDIRDFHSEEKFDLVLFLWMGMHEFSAVEQYPLLQNLAQRLSATGKLILDTQSIVPKQAAWNEDHVSIIEGKQNSRIYLYAPSDEQLNENAADLQLQIKHIHYLTNTNRPRTLHILNRFIS